MTNIVLNGKTKSIGLTGTMVGVLTNDDYLDRIERTMIECGKNILPFRIAGMRFILLLDLLGKPEKVWFFEFL